MSEIQQANPDVELVMIGNGTLKKSLESLAAELLRRFKFLGTQSPDVCKEWMHQAKLLVVPSITASNGDSKGLPTVLLEAQECIPVL